MNNKTLNEWAKEIHENAKAHGWWDEERSGGEILALCHSELSEALEEYRDGKPMLYYKCDCDPGICGRGCEWSTQSITCDRDYLNDMAGAIMKPCGIAVELVDCVIRILDYLAYINYEIENVIVVYEDYLKYIDFGTAVAIWHELISESIWSHVLIHNPLRRTVEINADSLDECVELIQQYFRANNIDMFEIIAIKHEYNKTRPYKHGGKVI